MAGWEWREEQRLQEWAWTMTHLVNAPRRARPARYDDLLAELLGPERMAAYMRRRLAAERARDR